MELDEKDKKLLIIIFILLFVLICLYTYHYVSTKKLNDEYAKQKAKEAKEILKEVEEEKEKPPKRGVVISYVKDYMLNNDMAHSDNIFIWEVTSVKLYKDNNNDYYYTVDGYYRCNQGNTCVNGLTNSPDINGNFDWGMIAKYDINTKEFGEVVVKDTITFEELEEVINNVE